MMLKGQLHWLATLLGDSRSVVLFHFSGICHGLQITSLFTIWKLRCKYVFFDEVSLVHSFCHSWRKELCMQLIKDAKEFNALAYFEFIAALVAVMKRIWESLNIPLCFWFDFFQRSCKFFDYNI